MMFFLRGTISLILLFRSCVYGAPSSDFVLSGSVRAELAPQKTPAITDLQTSLSSESEELIGETRWNQSEREKSLSEETVYLTSGQNMSRFPSIKLSVSSDSIFNSPRTTLYSSSEALSQEYFDRDTTYSDVGRDMGRSILTGNFPRRERIPKTLREIARNVLSRLVNGAVTHRVVQINNENSMLSDKPIRPTSSDVVNGTAIRKVNHGNERPSLPSHNDSVKEHFPVIQPLTGAEHKRARRQYPSGNYQNGSDQVPSISEVVTSTLVDLVLQEGRSVADQLISTALQKLHRQLAGGFGSWIEQIIPPTVTDSPQPTAAGSPAVRPHSGSLSEHERLQMQLGYARSGRRAALSEIRRLRQLQREQSLVNKADWSVARAEHNGDLLAMLWSIF